MIPDLPTSECLTEGGGGNAGACEWLLVIDMQHAFADPSSPWGTPGFTDLVPTIERLIASYGQRTIMTQYIAPKNPTHGWAQYFAAYPSMLLPEGATEWKLAVSYPPEAKIVARHTLGKWDSNTSTLVSPDASLAVCGVTTECCVLATVTAAIDDGRSVRVVEDACLGSNRKLHEQATTVLSTLGPQVTMVKAEEILAEME